VAASNSSTPPELTSQSFQNVHLVGCSDGVNWVEIGPKEPRVVGYWIQIGLSIGTRDILSPNVIKHGVALGTGAVRLVLRWTFGRRTI
jgi:hypothetical protein